MTDTLFFFLALTFLGVWIFVSGRNRKKAAEKLRSEVVKGATVMLTSGIFGKIASVKEDRVELETAPGQKLTVAIGAVSKVDQAPKASTASEAASKPKTKSDPKTKSETMPKTKSQAKPKPKAPKADSGK
jgi:preprotein translocase YajC subunit